MRALIYHNQRLSLETDYPKPTPVEGEALIRVLQAGICNTDLEIVRGYMQFNGVLGHEFVGMVEQVLPDRVREHLYLYPDAREMLGKRVVGEINAACQKQDCFYCSRGMPSQCPRRSTIGIVNRDGAFAEYLTLPIENLHMVPENVSDEEAIFVEPLAANFEMLEQVHIKPTDRIVVLGDGKMGQLAAQALALSGCEVMMVGKHEEKLALAAARGIATRRLEHTERFTLDGSGERRADMVVECSGSDQGLALAMRLVRPRGTIFLKSTVADQSTLHLAPIVIDEIRVQGSRCGPFAPALRALNRHSIDVRPLISATFGLNEGLKAFEYAAKPGVLKVLLRNI
jgi:threonine dehydrogenase-like Zn-dependent dehydrogenase